MSTESTWMARLAAMQQLVTRLHTVLGRVRVEVPVPDKGLADEIAAALDASETTERMAIEDQVRAIAARQIEELNERHQRDQQRLVDAANEDITRLTAERDDAMAQLAGGGIELKRGALDGGAA